MSDWVAFDLDGTLTRRETLVYFLRMYLGERRAMALLLRASPMMLGYALGWRSNTEAKEFALQHSLKGCHLEDLEPVAELFAREILPNLLRTPVLARMREHQRLGHRLVLVTATLELYARPWALAQGFEAVLGTRLELDAEQKLTGRLAGANCWGPEKTRRLRADLGITQLRYAYGNSRGDREMLAQAVHPICIHRANDYGRLLTPLGVLD